VSELLARAKALAESAGSTLPHRDHLNMIHRDDVARVAFKAVDLIEREKPAAQLHASALLFLALSERLGADPREVLERAERILATRRGDFDRKANAHFAALSDYIDHLHDPVKSIGMRHGDPP
jgi:hypothetical protein